jgi:serine/threonine protein kinase
VSEPAVGSPLSMHDPRQVGPWTIHSRLGAGGMGVVFYASSPGFQGAALKVIRPGLLDAPATRDRFRREVAILRSVHDAHISEFLAADLESEPAWLAIEYVAGPTLRDEIADNGPLAEDEWWKLARGMAQALAVLDKHRITHRDLKPGNVILGENGPELIDFGIAHPEDATSLTATGLVTGSPSWLSPEQATLEPTGPSSDIFALGSLLAYAATGRPPFGEGASVAVLMSIATREPDLVGIDPNRSALLQRMLAKDPARRPTARQVLDRVRGSTTGDTTLTDTPESTIALRGASAAAPVATLQPGPTAPPVRESSARPTPPPPAGTPPAPVLPPSSAPAPPPVRPRTAGNPRTVGPRTAAAQQRRATRRRVLVVVLVGLVLLVGGWFAVQALGGDSGDAGTGSGISTDAPASASDAPPAPSKDQLKDGNWLLATYRLDNTDDGLVVSGTVTNTGDATASADLTTWVYLGEESLGSVATTVADVPAGASVPVTMTGDAVWKKGQKVVLLQAS